MNLPNWFAVKFKVESRRSKIESQKPNPKLPSSKTAVLLLGHGSKATGANDAMYQIAATLKATGQFYLVECAFLEINQPAIATGLTICQEAGAIQIVIIPYFLHLGSHVQRDLPNIISSWQENNPAVEIIMGQHLGFSPLLISLVQERINEALTQQ